MMRRLLYVMLPVICVGIVLLSSGCAPDLFTSQRTHYHGTDQIEEKIQNLEGRVSTLEAEHGIDR